MKDWNEVITKETPAESKFKTFDDFKVEETNDSISVKDIDKVIKNLNDKNLDEKDIKILLDMATWFKSNFKSLSSY